VEYAEHTIKPGILFLCSLFSETFPVNIYEFLSNTGGCTTRNPLFVFMWLLGLYTILPLPILYGVYCNTRWSGGKTVLRNSVVDEGGGCGAQTKGVFANNSIDSCRKASS